MRDSTGRSEWRERFRRWIHRARGVEFPRAELEALLFEADLPASMVVRLLSAAESQRSDSEEAVLESLRLETIAAMAGVSSTASGLPIPGAILLAGINGSGKTTVAGKLASRFRGEGKPVVLAAADTFRAGAIEQLKQWSERTGSEVVAQKEGADAAAVAFDAWQRAIALGAVLIVDTAGRLHTKTPLMAELQKVARILGKDGRGAPHETYLVLDGTTGQNAMAQAREFSKALPLTGLIVTKLEGTARGGGALASSLELQVPIRYVGVGENMNDLKPFDLNDFVRDLLRA